MTNGEKFKEVFGFGADGSKVIAVNAIWWDCEFQDSKPITKRIPADNMRPMKRGKWLDLWIEDDEIIGGGYTVPQCSECNEDNYGTTPFCPFCGADMREANT